MTSALEWQFGGWLRSWPPSAAWGALAFLALAGLVLVFISYRKAARDLPSPTRILLAVLRSATLVLLLLCLANPTRVKRSRPETASRELAVLVDGSASMIQPDHRGTTRLADAVRIWKQHETEASQTFQVVNHYQFAADFARVGNFADTVKPDAAGSETHLYSALQKTLADKPAAIVCLTDGVDTTSDKVNEVINSAIDGGVPIYFVVGNNHTRVEGQLTKIREVRIPARVLRQSRFSVNAVVETFSPTAREVPMELWTGKTRLAATNQTVREGVNLVSWPVEVMAGEPTSMPLEFRIGSGSQLQIAGRTTRIVENTSVDLLYYQGALQWGYRFLHGALDSDPSFRVTAILNPALGVRLNATPENQLSMADLPDDARELKRFQIVVLANAFADLLTPKQQQALLEYARDGGGVLFISPDNEATRRFSGTVLEQMLPVIFESDRAPSSGEAERRFQEKMQAMGGASAPDETRFANQAIASRTVPDLIPFKAAPGTAGMRLFGSTGDVPRFNTYARVRALKPGAEILAVHPTDRSPEDNSPRVLVARQQFGDGFTVAMNTDLLWRWKLSLPSTNHAVEIFWQQFFLSLARPVQAEGLQLTSRTESAQIHRAATLSVSGDANSAPVLTVLSPQGKEQRLTTVRTESENSSAWQASFTPDVAGSWEAKVTSTEGDEAKMSIQVVDQVRSAELMNTPPDFDGLRQIAQATGGSLIESGDPAFNQHVMERPGEILSTQPLWNRSWLVGLLLGAYGAELITRRMFKLL